MPSDWVKNGELEKNSSITECLYWSNPRQPGSNGQVFIAQGYGLEGVIPDITCAQIVDNDILPAFREGDYYGGLDKAINSIMAITKGEFSAEDYGQKGSKNIRTNVPLVLFCL